MKTAALVSFAFLLASIGLSAQDRSIGVARMEGLSQTGPSNQVTVFQPPPIAQGCPVSMRAQHGPSGSMMQADRSRPKGLAQRLRLSLVNPTGRQIISARVRFHGLSGSPHSTQAVSDASKPDAVQTLSVRFLPDTGQAVIGDVWVPAMTAVLTVELKSVTFSDGSTRTFDGDDRCSVAPDLKMLVAGR